MTKLLWDQVGERSYDAGLDRGVLYLEENKGVPWNGLTSMEEDLSEEISDPTYVDGIKATTNASSGAFEASLKAFTYPDEFLELDGIVELHDGMFVDGQHTKTFGLSYRTFSGNDIDEAANYKIHILYNLTALSDDKGYETMTDTVDPLEFAWNISGVPEEFAGYKPTVHVVIDVSYLDDVELNSIESILYGTPGADPRLPPIEELTTAIGATRFVIVINSPDYNLLPPDAVRGDIIFALSDESVYSWGVSSNNTRPVFVVESKTIPENIKSDDIVYDKTTGIFYKLGV